MRVDVDESRSDDAAARVDRLATVETVADRNDAPIVHRDIRDERLPTRTVDDRAALDDQIGLHELVLPLGQASMWVGRGTPAASQRW